MSALPAPDSLEADFVEVITAAQKWIDFDEAKHRYYIDGKLVPSVTTIIDGVLSKPALIAWAARVQREADLAFMRDAIAAGHGLDAIVSHLTHSKANAHQSIKEAAGDLGTEVHALIENWCNESIGKAPENSTSVSEDALFVFEGFAQWAKDVQLQPILLEQRVAHRRLGYAGKIDFLGYCEGRLVIIDWKSAKGIWDSFDLQAVAYAKAIDDMGLPEPEAMIVRLPKEGGDQIEPYAVKGDYDDIFRAFRGLLDAYRWRQARGRK